jgi:hypothetical protein
MMFPMNIIRQKAIGVQQGLLSVVFLALAILEHNYAGWLLYVRLERIQRFLVLLQGRGVKYRSIPTAAKASSSIRDRKIHCMFH